MRLPISYSKNPMYSAAIQEYHALTDLDIQPVTFVKTLVDRQALMIFGNYKSRKITKCVCFGDDFSMESTLLKESYVMI